MAGPQNPRKQPHRDCFSTPPPAAAFSTPPPSAASVGAGRDTPLPCNTLRSASKKSEVLLCDWWLVAAAEAREGRRLCIGGVVARRCPWSDARSGSKSLLSPWPKAERVFESAPITKRYDAFTLGTADGITVKIHGVVNQARSRQNGFPVEVSEGFLVGFPYNWDSYAGACFEETYNGASAPANAASANDTSKGLSDTKDCLFTEYLDDFTLRRIHGASMDGIDGSVTKKFRDFLERFCNRYSGNTTKRMLSDVQDCTTPTVKSCLPQETPNRFEGEIIDGLVTEGLKHLSHFEKVSVSSPSGQWETLVEGLGLTPVLKETLSEKENYETEINRNKHENGTNHGLAAGPSNATGCHRDVLQADEINWSEMDLIGKNLHGSVDETLLTENDTAHLEHGNPSQSVVRKLYYTTLSGPLVGSSTISESECLGKRRNKAMKIVEQTPATDAALVSRMTKLKNQGDSERISSLEAESNEGSSVQVDHSFVKTAGDGKPKRGQISACDLATAGAVKFSLESSTRVLHIDPVPTIRLADQQTSVNTEHEGEYFELPAANTTQSDNLVEMHPSKEKKSDVIICETRDKLSTQRKKKKNYLRKKTKSSFPSKKKQSSLSVNQDCKKTRSLRSSHKTIWRPSYDSQCPLTRDRATKLCIASPESLDLKRSRAGRLLVPRIEEWCQRIVYAKDGEIAAISGDNLDNFPVVGIHSEPPRKRRRHV